MLAEFYIYILLQLNYHYLQYILCIYTPTTINKVVIGGMLLPQKFLTDKKTLCPFSEFYKRNVKMLDKIQIICLN